MSTDAAILSRIQKLLALTQSDNENESALAASKAQELLLLHNVDEEELRNHRGDKQEEVIEILSKGITAHNRIAWHYTLAGYVAHSNLCKLLLGTGSNLIWIGKRSNVEVAQYILENLIRDLTRICEREWFDVNFAQKYASPYKKVHGKTWKNSFYHGAISTINERLTANLRQLTTSNDSISALVVHNNVELREYMTKHYPNLSYVQHSINKDRSAFERGQSAGRSVGFRSGLGAGGSAGPKLLGKGDG